MNIVLEGIITLFLTFYYILEAVVLFFIPFSFRRKSVKGERVLITGAGSGLGRGLAQQFAKLGATVVIVDVNKNGIEETRHLIVEELGGSVSVHTYQCDLSSKQDVYKVLDKVKSEVGDIDILINNAGIVSGKKILECPDDLMIKTMEVNAISHFWTVKSVLPAMMAKNHGHIVTIASAAGLTGVNGLVDYCASKFAAVGFDESIRNEMHTLGKTGINTTVICPYYIQTGMFKGIVTRFPTLLPFLEPEYVVGRIMDGVLCNQSLVAIPRCLYISLALKGMLPTKAWVVLQTFLGINNTMDEFVGRNKSE